MKRTHVSGVMWLVIILVNTYLSISDPAKTNDTTSVCDGSLQECLNAGHLESEFPTIAALTSPECLVKSKVRPLLQQIVDPHVPFAMTVIEIVLLMRRKYLKNVAVIPSKEVVE